MKPFFNAKRDMMNKMIRYRYRNDKCLFQFHSAIELYFVTEGEMELFVRGQRTVLSAGQVSVALSYDAHSYTTPNESCSAVLLIPSALCEEFVSEMKGKELNTPFVTDPAVCKKLWRYYQELGDAKISPLRQQGYIYVMLGLITEHVGVREKENAEDMDLASSILFYIDEHFQEEITPASVSEHFGYNQSYLSRYFKSCMGITMGKYITAVKLRHAVRLLREGKRDMTYCAMESGFSAMRTFYRAFHNEFGCSPKEYMDELQQKEDT